MCDNDFLEDLPNIKYEDFLNHFILFKKEDVVLNNSNRIDHDQDNFNEKNKYDENSNLIIYLANYIINNKSNAWTFRRIYWPLLLGIYKCNDIQNLIINIEKKRNLYKQDKEEYITKQKNLNIQKLDPQIFHPLSSDDKNPWTLKQKNQELNDEIKQDILRTHSEKKIFQNQEIRDILNKILFIWAKKNPSISYKQGMNEILAIFFIVNYREQVYNDYLNHQNEIYYRQFCILFDKEEIESDAYIIFDHFMNMGLKYLFTSVEEKKTSSNKSSCKTVLLQKCTCIFHKLLKNSDKLLYNHLISLSIEPQIFLLRWIRLFYCREFQIDDTVILWDNFFSDCCLNNSENDFHFDFKGDSIEIAHQISCIFPLVDYFAISMIIFIRSFLLENDENLCLKRLFKYPPVENIRILIDLTYKIKSRSEKKEKSVKKDKSVTPNKTNSVVAMESSNDLNTNLNYNLNYNLNIFQIQNNTKNNNTVNEYIERNKYNPNLNVLALNKEVKNVDKSKTLAHMNNKLRKIIDNLTMLSLNILDENHRMQLYQNIFNLNEIYNELQHVEQKYERSDFDSIEIKKKNEIPIYMG